LNDEYDSLGKEEYRLSVVSRRPGMPQIYRNIELNPARIQAIARRDTRRVNPTSNLPA
jgi:hypothetical protein